MANNEQLTVVNANLVSYDFEVLEQGFAALDALNEELGGDSNPEFATAKTPSSGMTVWSIKADKDDNDPEITKTIDGVIVYSHKSNAYWENSLDAGGGVQPDCRSADGVTGMDKDGNIRMCADCPYNQFGSDGGRGKACKNSRVLYVLRQDCMLPIKVMLAPTGNKPFDKYVESLVIPKKKGQRPRRTRAVVTRIGLKVETSAGGQKYSLPTFERIGDLDDTSKDLIQGYAEGLKATATKMNAPKPQQSASDGSKTDFVEVNDKDLPF